MKKLITTLLGILFLTTSVFAGTGSLLWDTVDDWGLGSGVKIDTTTYAGRVTVPKTEYSYDEYGVTSSNDIGYGYAVRLKIIPRSDFSTNRISLWVFPSDIYTATNTINIHIANSDMSTVYTSSYAVSVSSNPDNYFTDYYSNIRRIPFASTVSLTENSTYWIVITSHTGSYEVLTFYLGVECTFDTNPNPDTLSKSELLYKINGTPTWRTFESQGMGSIFYHLDNTATPEGIPSYTTSVKTTTDKTAWGTFNVVDFIPVGTTVTYCVKNSSVPLKNGDTIPSATGDAVQIVSSFTYLNDLATSVPYIDSIQLTYTNNTPSTGTAADISSNPPAGSYPKAPSPQNLSQFATWYMIGQAAFYASSATTPSVVINGIRGTVDGRDISADGTTLDGVVLSTGAAALKLTQLAATTTQIQTDLSTEVSNRGIADTAIGVSTGTLERGKLSISSGTIIETALANRLNISSGTTISTLINGKLDISSGTTISSLINSLESSKLSISSGTIFEQSIAGKLPLSSGTVITSLLADKLSISSGTIIENALAGKLDISSGTTITALLAGKLDISSGTTITSLFNTKVSTTAWQDYELTISTPYYKSSEVRIIPFPNDVFIDTFTAMVQGAGTDAVKFQMEARAYGTSAIAGSIFWGEGITASTSSYSGGNMTTAKLDSGYDMYIQSMTVTGSPKALKLKARYRKK